MPRADITQTVALEGLDAYACQGIVSRSLWVTLWFVDDRPAGHPRSFRISPKDARRLADALEAGAQALEAVTVTP